MVICTIWACSNEKLTDNTQEPNDMTIEMLIEEAAQQEIVSNAKFQEQIRNPDFFAKYNEVIQLKTDQPGPIC